MLWETVTPGTSSSATLTEAEPLWLSAVYPVPLSTVALSEPSSSSARSSTVETVSVAVPAVPTDTSRTPVWPPPAKLPLSVTRTLTVIAVCGFGVALRLNWAVPPSVTSAPPAMLTTGCGASSLRMECVAVPEETETATPPGGSRSSSTTVSSLSTSVSPWMRSRTRPDVAFAARVWVRQPLASGSAASLAKFTTR